MKSNLDCGRLSFTTDLHSAVASSDIVFIAVGTPSLDDGQADLSQVIQVAEDIVWFIDSYKVIVIKSTVQVGTVELVLSILRRERQEGQHFDIVANPEFLREGNGLHDFFYPHRIVIGASSEKAWKVMRDLYEPIVLGNVPWPEHGPQSRTNGTVPLVETDMASAQMIKYASNAFLAARISFINEIAGLCERVGTDIKEVVRGMEYDLRIGQGYLEAGLGLGGPCLAKDLKALIRIGEGNSYEPHFLKAILERNERQVGEVVAKLKQLIGYLLYKKIVAGFGLAFKPGTNDVRNSLSPKVIERLQQEGAVVRAHDPVAIPNAKLLNPGVDYCEDPYEAVRNADALLILTDWPQFRGLDYREIKARMATPRIVDARNLLDAAELREMGFTYVGIGRP